MLIQGPKHPSVFGVAVNLFSCFALYFVIVQFRSGSGSLPAEQPTLSPFFVEFVARYHSIVSEDACNKLEIWCHYQGKSLSIFIQQKFSPDTQRSDLRPASKSFSEPA